MFARIQRSSGRQIIISSHSSDLLKDEGIGLDEVLLLKPTGEGTEVQPASKISQVENLLQGGMNLSEIVIPQTRPEKAEQLSLFGS